MKKFNYFLLILSVSSLLFALSCKKTNVGDKSEPTPDPTGISHKVSYEDALAEVNLLLESDVFNDNIAKSKLTNAKKKIANYHIVPVNGPVTTSSLSEIESGQPYYYQYRLVMNAGISR